MTHANAPLTPVGRPRLAELIVVHGWAVRRAAERFQCSPATASKWAARLRAGEPMTDRSSRPHSCPAKTPTRLERRIVKLRYCRRWGPHRISYHLGVPRSTVGRVLQRYRMPLLAHLDQATGLPVCKPKPTAMKPRHRASSCTWTSRSSGGSLMAAAGACSDATRLSTGARFAGRSRAARSGGSPARGYVFLHHAVDDHSRLVYSEQLLDERKETAAAFWLRANAFFTDAGIAVQAVMTDNGSCYRSHAFAAALGQGVKHRRTRPYRPQTNGKVFNRTLVAEWAHAEVYLSNEARAATYADWLHSYNHHRPHTGIGGQVPADRVHNVTGNYS